MNILDTIVEYKRTEVRKNRSAKPMAELEKSGWFARQTLSLRESLTDPAGTGIIAEFKRRSPSRGVINDRSDVVDVTTAYTAHGAACLSVLTDENFFGGHRTDLEKARVNAIPILRKDFMVDEYQVLEARAMGADVILLIAACLSPGETRRLALFARSLGLEVLLEIYSEQELGHISDETDIVGVNNRDLRTFTVDTDRSIALREKIPAGKLAISESGISHAGTIRRLRQAGFSGFLIGENFMKEADPGAAFGKFVAELKNGDSL
ncbi:MAG: indole-3-glycerol phosphate synthase TrpC [Bacteroidota bacterium]|nr:indole-3-glycerol phosphate synthase TrpC [Bacteroidota bacterium]MDP4217343.1 indole-3-glycerol phosphate synthase TrpC [Bacteroidota bacterium]MDP4245774.1 indole-3-glycerol phosphate synthase TrpC [Bacteroidota bacterium]MDP4253569.1 indole-3-glycerol phosphate synthase TrpC [Bacteroidota bacterium]MDP4257082.1 indole-3-glycerol phosphate synthase TrpC [Bacteroidota bacterium]